MKVIILLLVTLVLIFNQISIINGYGESINGYPNAKERENFNLINLVRVFPLEYKANYMTGYSGLSNVFTKYGNSVPPVYYDYTLNQLARSHSQDMATNRCFQHDSCNGQSIWTRFDSYITCNGQSSGENIAAGSTPFDANNLLVCDEVNGACAPDNSGNDGHRVNIMSDSFKTMGVGWVEQSGSTYSDYLTQDFHGGNCNSISNPIYSAYHTFYPSTSIQFIAIFYSGTESVSKFSLIFEDGTTYDLPLTYGSTSKGAFITTLPSVTSCAKYYFSATTTTSNTYNMPESGYFQVSKSSTCAGWVDGDQNTSNPTTEAPTTQPPTEAPTTEAPTTQPPTEAPTTQPPTEAPTTEAPTTQPPTEAPTTEAPTTQPPTEAPTTQPPTEAPTTQPPTEAPTTEAPTTQPPTEAPTTQPPTEAPTTQPPTEAPTTEAPTTQPPTEVPTDSTSGDQSTSTTNDNSNESSSTTTSSDNNQESSTNESSNESSKDSTGIIASSSDNQESSTNESSNDNSNNDNESTNESSNDSSKDSTGSITSSSNNQESSTNDNSNDKSTSSNSQTSTQSSSTSESNQDSSISGSSTSITQSSNQDSSIPPANLEPTSDDSSKSTDSNGSNAFTLKAPQVIIISLISFILFF